MIKKELINRSPIRVLENSLHGGLGKGNLGVFTARKGTGKTACLIHVATDKLLREQGVLHISFSENPHHIQSWYKQVFDEVAAAYKLSDAIDIFDEITNKRFILHFKQSDLTFDKIEENIDQLIKSLSYQPECFIIDGYIFENASNHDFKSWKNLAIKKNVEIWFTATLHRENLQFDINGIPNPVSHIADLFAVIIMLDPSHDYIDLKLLKDHDSKDITKLRLKLDPKTLLIANHRI
jgi:KaiC/GvpD/RAD55 family RecA-like ATPase